jgi:hypothetical protein
MVKAFRTIYNRLTAAGTAPRLHTLDNERPTIVRMLIQGRQSKYQLVPPHDHRRNAAERAIRTFNNHFIATLCSVDPNFPKHPWDRLLPHAEFTLNKMRAARDNPRNAA